MLNTINGFIITLKLKTKHKFFVTNYIVLEISTTTESNKLLTYSKLVVFNYGKS